MNNVGRCSDCESEDREGGQYCEACGKRIEPEGAGESPQFARTDAEDEGSSLSWGEDEPDSMSPEDTGATDSAGEDEGSSDSKGVGDEEPSSPMGEDESEPTESGDADMAGSTDDDEAGSKPMEAEEGFAPELPKTGYLVFPDGMEQPISPSQWLIGRADLTKFLHDPKQTNEISRGHLTVFKDGERFFVEDGKTMVQEKASSNKTWLVRGGDRILVTGTGRNELQDFDEIDVAELVKLQFVLK